MHVSKLIVGMCFVVAIPCMYCSEVIFPGKNGYIFLLKVSVKILLLHELLFCGGKEITTVCVYM